MLNLPCYLMLFMFFWFGLFIHYLNTVVFCWVSVVMGFVFNHCLCCEISPNFSWLRSCDYRGKPWSVSCGGQSGMVSDSFPRLLMGEPPGKYCCIYLVCLFEVEGKAVGFTFLENDEKGTEIQCSSTVHMVQVVCQALWKCNLLIKY